jgi:hypothetical protein
VALAAVPAVDQGRDRPRNLPTVPASPCPMPDHRGRWRDSQHHAWWQHAPQQPIRWPGGWRRVLSASASSSPCTSPICQSRPVPWLYQLTESARLLIGEPCSTNYYAECWPPPRGHVSLDVYRIEDVTTGSTAWPLLARWKRPSAFVVPRSGSTPRTAAAPSPPTCSTPDAYAVQVQGLMGHASLLPHRRLRPPARACPPCRRGTTALPVYDQLRRKPQRPRVDHWSTVEKAGPSRCAAREPRPQHGPAGS